jgi:hypothetical protein
MSLFGAKTPPLDIAGAHARFRALLNEASVESDRGRFYSCAMCDFHNAPSENRNNDVQLESSRTRYPRNPKEPDVDPNAPIPLCRPCAKEHHERWDAEWAEYHSGS